MENLPESLYVDPREVASSSSSTTQWNTTQSFSATDRPGIEQLIKLLNRPQTRAEAINQLNRVSKIYKCIASHPEARMGCIKAQMPVYIYPFLNTTEQQLVQFDYLRINSLGVIATLVKVATLLLGKILEQQEGKRYCGSFVERFFAVSKALSKMVDEFSGKPPAPIVQEYIY